MRRLHGHGALAIVAVLAGCSSHTFRAPESASFAEVSGRVTSCFIGCGWEIETDDGSECLGFSAMRDPRNPHFVLSLTCDSGHQTYDLPGSSLMSDASSR